MSLRPSPRPSPRLFGALSSPPAAALLLCCAGAAWAAPVPVPAPIPTVTVAWRDKPPYHYLDHEVGRGFLLTRTQAVFDAAGIPTRFVLEPQKRIWANFSHGATNYCSFSWYRLPERETVAQFTLPIHIDPPQSVLAAPAAVARVRAHTTLSALLADPTLTLGVVDGVSYGPELDALIAHSGNMVMRRTVDTTSMVRMLAVGRASFMFVDREDWEYFIRREPTLQATVRLEFPDMPPGLKRHIACSLDVAPAVMDRLNQAILNSGGASRSEHGGAGKPRQRP